METPLSEFIPVVDGGHPSSCTVMFSAILFGFVALYLHDEVDLVLELDDEVWLVAVGDVGVLIRNAKAKMVVADIVINYLRLL